MKAVLIADDLTGANNAGVLVAKQGFPTVTVRHTRLLFPDSCDAVCVDTDSRHLPAAEARNRVRETTLWAGEQGAGTFCNRVDNLLRGNIGAELEGVLDGLGPRALAVVAPAFPALERHVVGGRLLVNGAPVTENPVAASDPFAPVKHSFIPDLIATQSDVPCTLIPQDDVTAGTQMLSKRLREIVRSGARIVVVDAITDAHLQTVASAMATLDIVAIPVDPGVLSACFLRAHSDHQKPTVQDDKAIPERSVVQGDRVIISLGSVTSLSRQQFDYLIAKRQLDAVVMDPLSLVAGGDNEREAISQAVAESLDQLESCSVVALTTGHPGKQALDLETIAAEQKTSPHALSKRISDALAKATCETIVASNGAVGGCFASGGDVTASLFDVAGAEMISIIDNVIPLTAYVAFNGGTLDGLRLVTKGGSIGNEDAMETCVNHLVADLADAIR